MNWRDEQKLMRSEETKEERRLRLWLGRQERRRNEQIEEQDRMSRVMYSLWTCPPPKP
jgi:predicted alpha/beta superfamily hydrolase